MSLIESLTDRQRRTGESDKLFARRLGLSRQAWQKIRTGQCGLGARALAGIVRAYPELLGSVNTHLSTSADLLQGQLPLGPTATKRRAAGRPVEEGEPRSTRSRKRSAA